MRTLTEQEQTVGSKLLGDAWAIIVSRVPGAETRLADPVFTSLATQVQCSMVLRVLRNPEGKLEEQGDDYRYRLDAAVSTGALYLSDAEFAMLTPSGVASSGAFTIRPAGYARSRSWDAESGW
ncbi:hypothetical protein [Rathayibacter sp. VKM Ac-2630]|uniref:hypothetical protein n=1 Tax=Rathayibacter sp. VKM Ac-2630 TaxID=1938617 RepID=UPI000981DA22|nr:hypothetical protein [Rathayibacter sp. VKM Ac-2630]OOB91193.1 hypothetical protein B0T42_07275 [Rathayibacter sp. VKM Ac-2630]